MAHPTKGKKRMPHQSKLYPGFTILMGLLKEPRELIEKRLTEHGKTQDCGYFQRSYTKQFSNQNTDSYLFCRWFSEEVTKVMASHDKLFSLEDKKTITNCLTELRVMMDRARIKFDRQNGGR